MQPFNRTSTRFGIKTKSWSKVFVMLVSEQQAAGVYAMYL